MFRLTILLLGVLLLHACRGGETPQPADREAPAASDDRDAAAVAEPEPFAGYTAFRGATVWDGTGGAAQQNATLLVKGGRIVDMPADGNIAGAEVVDFAGRYIVPGFINAHGHVSGYWAADSVTDPADRIREDLSLLARYGITTVLSLGGEPQEATAVRLDQDNLSLDHARFLFAGDVVADNDPAAASATTVRNVARDVDWIKLRVDDNLGSGEKMPWEAVQAVFNSARAANKPVATHIFYLDDAARVLDLGSALIAHSVRDQRVDDAFVAKILESGVCYVPTLTREVSTFAYGDRPNFFADPFFLEAAKQSEIDRVSDPQYMARVRENPSSDAYRKALVQAQENLRILLGSGVPVAFGTDSGPAGRFPGYFEHLEMYLMVFAGLTPRETLLSATSVAADCLGLDDLGTLEAGNWADFVVLAEDPLQDILATRSIDSVYIAGNKVAR